LLIMKAHKNNEMPPSTSLGGSVGIHGVGKGNPKIQGVFDWTHGCVALSNKQVDKLVPWVYLGMAVVIK